MKTIEVTIEYARRHLQPEVRHRGGTFDPKTKKWNLPETPDNRALAHLIETPVSAPTLEERTRNVALVAVDLLNAIKPKRYRLVECGDRILIEEQSANV